VRIAQTNIQLYNQLREAGRSLDELVTVHRAYELLTTLYPGYYQSDGKPFVAHGVGVASILGWLDQPAEIVAVGLLHNVYGNADFGDGRRAGVTPARSRLIRETVGERMAGLIERFRDVRIHPDTLEDMRRSLPERTETDRQLILVELADQLEKYVDLGLLYFGDNDWVEGERMGAGLVELANELDEPRLAEMLSSAFAEAAAAAAHVPAELRAPDGRSFLKLVVPMSCRRKLGPRVRARIRRAFHS
jgi:(p)ppGpp synthase/HD superfamily hydrolase